MCTEALLSKATIADVPEIHRMVNEVAEIDRTVLPRSLAALYESVRDFTVARIDGRVVGCCALHIIWGDLAEVRSLVVAKRHQRQGIGARLLASSVEEGRELNLPRLFALTYVPDFFVRHGFRLVDREQLPRKIWSDCINCPRFPDCSEEALIRDL
jgi:amino-acid N-acetyltransferase